MANKAKKIIAIVAVISACQTPLILDAFGIDVGGIYTIILTEVLMALLIGFLARSLYWSQDSIKPNNISGANFRPNAPIYQALIKKALEDPCARDAKLDQFAFDQLTVDQKEELIEALKEELKFDIPGDEKLKVLDKNCHYSEYLKIYNFIEGNKDGGFADPIADPIAATRQEAIANPLAIGAEFNEETFNMLKDNQKQKLLKKF